MANKQKGPVGAPPAVLALHKDQTLDANELAHALKENAEHTLEELDEAMSDGRLTRAEFGTFAATSPFASTWPTGSARSSSGRGPV
jgi:hypothetical protein